MNKFKKYVSLYIRSIPFLLVGGAGVGFIVGWLVYRALGFIDYLYPSGNTNQSEVVIYIFIWSSIAFTLLYGLHFPYVEVYKEEEWKEMQIAALKYSLKDIEDEE